jgi:predicted membrane protein
VWATLGKALGAALVGVLIAWVLINWMMGCGETFTTIDGAIIHGECITLTLGAF